MLSEIADITEHSFDIIENLPIELSSNYNHTSSAGKLNDINAIVQLPEIGNSEKTHNSDINNYINDINKDLINDIDISNSNTDNNLFNKDRVELTSMNEYTISAIQMDSTSPVKNFIEENMYENMGEKGNVEKHKNENVTAHINIEVYGNMSMSKIVSDKSKNIEKNEFHSVSKNVSDDKEKGENKNDNEEKDILNRTMLIMKVSLETEKDEEEK